MLFNFINTLKKLLNGPDEQEKLDAFITQQQPTSVCDVEYWINVYDRRQHSQRSSNFGYF